jgi:hypothetical protein
MILQKREHTSLLRRVDKMAPEAIFKGISSFSSSIIETACAKPDGCAIDGNQDQE